MKKFLALILFVPFFAAPLAAQEYTGTLQQIRDSGEIRIGFREAEPPMSYLGSDGTAQGYSVDICNEIVSAMNEKLGKELKVSYVKVSAEERFSALTDNRIDILCGSTTQTLARRELVDFTLFTFVTGASLMSLKSNNLLDFPSLAGKKVGVVKNTTTVDRLRETLVKAQTEATVVELDSGRDALTQLRNGEIDAFSADQVVLIGMALGSDDVASLAISAGVFSFEPLALAVRRNDSDLRLVADRVIADLYRSEEIIPIYQKWMGRFSSNRPPVFDTLFQLNAIPEK